MISLAQLKAIMPYSRERADVFLDPLNAAMTEFDIGTPLRAAAFLAQIAHESGSLRYVKEIATGSAYEGRRDLGNVHEGDGPRFKGRGLIQITGRANYRAVSMALSIDCEMRPELLESRENACRSAAWFWSTHGLSALADVGDFERITRRINGGLTGQADRAATYAVALNILGVV